MDRKVVVTGLGAVTPIGNDIPAFRENLFAGRHGIAGITRFDTTEYKTKYAAEVKDFDPKLYMEHSDTRRTDLFAQFALGAAVQAMEDSGIHGTVAPERFSVVLGTGIGGIITLSEEIGKLREKGPRRVSPYLIPMMISNMAAGNIAIRYDLRGSAIAPVTACASGTNAIGEAARMIRHGYTDAALAGGCEASIAEVGVAGFINMQALSTAEDPDAASLPFDSRRAGFVIGEGAGVLILEEKEHALARGAKIYGEVAGYGSTCDAYHITAPHPEGVGAVSAMRLALADAGFTPDEKLYINAHGTGTPLNDAMETAAIKEVLGAEKAAATPISSTKSMTGHMLGAAGAVEAIACLLAFAEGKLPPTVGLTSPDPALDLDYVPIVSREADIDVALSNSLGFGGHNACVVLRRV
ncbi:MAG: beta-ketoacyl-ACP synthase II [Clostridiales Family XIII bacterium]|nr:beta-ketoacyl-ACP synthase II [Clostridiales Family XIII bacterium]